MKSSRQRLTHLSKKTSDIMPDGPDIFGFQGISKPIILESISESYSMLGNLEDFNNKFETIFLKRKLADYTQNANDLLDSINDKGNFNKFLDVISKIHYKIKETYIAVANEPIRTEVEINKAKEDLAVLSQNLQQIQGIVDEINNLKQSSTEFLKDLQERENKSIGNEKIIDGFLSEIEETKNNLDETESQIVSWREIIKQINESITLKSKEIQEIATNVSVNNDKCLKNLESINSQLSEQAEIVKVNQNQQEEIQNTLEDANRLGMAGSFKKRKDELTWPLRFWTFATVASLIGLIAVTFFILAPLLKSKVELNDLYVKIPIFASCVWLGWFCAKQYGFTSRIREDYAYKYAVSMAFEGYKNETREIDEDLLRSLLELTIFNVQKNPISIFDTKSNHGTPYHEAFENFCKSFKKNKQTE